MKTLEQGEIRNDIEYGSFVRFAEPPVLNRLIISTFNIRYAVGSFLITGSLLRRVGMRRPRYRTLLVTKNILRAAMALSNGVLMPRPDFIALQEADKFTVRAGGIHVARELARALQMQYTHASLNSPQGEQQKAKQWYLDFEEHIGKYESGDTGLALLSRVPFSETTRLELPWTECAWRPRLALKTRIPFGDGELQVYNVHIDPHASTNEQLEQHSTILKDAIHSHEPTVILGDFNTLTPDGGSRMRDLLEASGFVTPFRTGLKTWRAGLIRLQPDWIFVRRVKVLRCGVARGLRISDHWPLWAELEVENQGGDK